MLLPYRPSSPCPSFLGRGICRLPVSRAHFRQDWNIFDVRWKNWSAEVYLWFLQDKNALYYCFNSKFPISTWKTWFRGALEQTNFSHSRRRLGKLAIISKKIGGSGMLNDTWRRGKWFWMKKLEKKEVSQCRIPVKLTFLLQRRGMKRSCYLGFQILFAFCRFLLIFILLFPFCKILNTQSKQK